MTTALDGTAAPGAVSANASTAHGSTVVRPVNQLRVLKSEWIKLRTLRSTLFTLLAAIVFMIGIGWLATYEANSHWASMDLRERFSFNAIDRSLVGLNLAQLAVGVLGVLVVSGEYTTGMIRATFSAVPRRLPVLWAKIAVFAVVTFVLMLASAFAAFGGGQALLGSHGVSLSAPGALRAVFGVALYLTVVAVLGVGLGFVLRSTPGGITTLFGILLVVPVIVRVLPSSWQEHIAPYLPSNAGAQLFSQRPDWTTLSPWGGFGVMCAYAVALIVVAAVVVRRRDA